MARTLDSEQIALERSDHFIHASDESAPPSFAIGSWSLYDTVSIKQNHFDRHALSLSRAFVTAAVPQSRRLIAIKLPPVCPSLNTGLLCRSTRRR